MGPLELVLSFAGLAAWRALELGADALAFVPNAVSRFAGERYERRASELICADCTRPLSEHHRQGTTACSWFEARSA